MSYFHIDLAELEARMRSLRAESLPRVISKAQTQSERDGYARQDRFFEAGLAAHIEMARLLNEGCGAKMVGATVGAHIGNVISNTLIASDDPATCWGAIQWTIQNTLMALNGQGEGVTTSEAEVTKTFGGRC